MQRHLTSRGAGQGGAETQSDRRDLAHPGVVGEFLNGGLHIFDPAGDGRLLE